MSPALEDLTTTRSFLQVFTRLGLAERGQCCGNRCRHCPYAHMRVQGPRAAGKRVNVPAHPVLLDAKLLKASMAAFQVRTSSEQVRPQLSPTTTRSPSRCTAAPTAVYQSARAWAFDGTRPCSKPCASSRCFILMTILVTNLLPGGSPRHAGALGWDVGSFRPKGP